MGGKKGEREGGPGERVREGRLGERGGEGRESGGERDWVRELCNISSSSSPIP